MSRFPTTPPICATSFAKSDCFYLRHFSLGHLSSAFLKSFVNSNYDVISSPKDYDVISSPKDFLSTICPVA